MVLAAIFVWMKRFSVDDVVIIKLVVFHVPRTYFLVPYLNRIDLDTVAIVMFIKPFLP